ncbi:MAG: hypothetical protein OEY56_07445 [Cyclobacteriaceae bacterium]|nr:hypothetical protein [Cyclobacteriaceae bacterium]
MGDQFERFILDNRDGFEEDISNEAGVWSRIERQLPPSRTSRGGWFWKVASVFLLLVSTVLVIDKIRNDEKDVAVVVNAEFIEVESYYTRQINERRTEIAQLVSGQMALDFNKDLEELDSMYLYLKEGMSRQEENPKLINAMIENLQLRIEILNQQLSVIQQINQLQNENISEI